MPVRTIIIFLKKALELPLLCRKVIGLLAGLMSLTDAAEEGTNINKLHMARFLSNLLFVEKMNS